MASQILLELLYYYAAIFVGLPTIIAYLVILMLITTATVAIEIISPDYRPGKLQETISAVVAVFCLYCNFVGLWMFFGLLFSPCFFYSIMYAVFLYCDSNKPNEGGRRSEWYRKNSIHSYFRDYFPMILVKTVDLDQGKNYIFGYHNHGLAGFGSHCFATESAGFSEKFPGFVPYLMTSESNFRWPFYRDYLMAAGACSDSKESIEYLLRTGTNRVLVLSVGGAEEIGQSEQGAAKIVLANKKEFVEIALKRGASLVPVFAFGENEILRQCNVRFPEGTFVRKLQHLLKRSLGISIPLSCGQGLLPFRKGICVVVGAPIVLEATEEPTPRQIEETHALYVERLTILFNAHKEDCNYPGLELAIV